MEHVARQANKLSESCFATIDAFHYDVALQYAICGGVKARKTWRLPATSIHRKMKLSTFWKGLKKPSKVHIETDDELDFGSSQLR